MTRSVEELICDAATLDMSEYIADGGVTAHDEWAKQMRAAIAALTAPPPSADDVALVDALLKEEIKAGRIECYCGGQAFKRGYEAARLSQRRADRDAVTEECSSVPFMIDGMPSSLAHKTKEAILSLKEKHT